MYNIVAIITSFVLTLIPMTTSLICAWGKSRNLSTKSPSMNPSVAFVLCSLANDRYLITQDCQGNFNYNYNHMHKLSLQLWEDTHHVLCSPRLSPPSPCSLVAWRGGRMSLEWAVQWDQSPREQCQITGASPEWGRGQSQDAPSPEILYTHDRCMVKIQMHVPNPYPHNLADEGPHLFQIHSHCLQCRYEMVATCTACPVPRLPHCIEWEREGATAAD